MESIVAFIRQMVVTAIKLGMLYMAFALELHGAQNLLKGFIVIIFMLSLAIAAILHSDSPDVDRLRKEFKPPSKLREGIWKLVTGLELGILLWFGWFFFAALHGCSFMFMVASYEQCKKQ